MAKIYFGRSGTKPDQADFKGQKEISWCQNNLGPLTFHSPLANMPKMPDEESQVETILIFILLEHEKVLVDLKSKLKVMRSRKDIGLMKVI